MSVNIRRIGYFLLAFLLPLCCPGIYEGQSPESVLEEMGEPNGTRLLANGELWVYSGGISLEFENGRLMRSRGLDLLSAPDTYYTGDSEEDEIPEAKEPLPAAAQQPAAEAEASSSSSGTLTSDAVKDRTDEDDELMETAEALSNPAAFLEEEEPESPSASALEEILSAVVPIFLQWIFLLIAFKVTGAEASKLILFGIAIIDRLVVMGVQWIFIGFLEFPTAFHADTLVSVFVMLALITSFTHAKKLSTALEVVIASKVAAFIAGYVFVLFLLSQF